MMLLGSDRCSARAAGSANYCQSQHHRKWLQGMQPRQPLSPHSMPDSIQPLHRTIQQYSVSIASLLCRLTLHPPLQPPCLDS